MFGELSESGAGSLRFLEEEVSMGKAVRNCSWAKLEW